MSGIWFIDDFTRMNAERAAVAELEQNSGWLSGTHWFLFEGGLALDATITIEERHYAVRVTYPEFFPAVPPVVRPQNAGEHWSSHQYGDGTLCLEWGPDTWSPSVTGAMMIESTHRLLTLENPAGPLGGAPAPSRHQLTQGQEVRFERRRLLVSDVLLDCLATVLSGEIRIADFAVHYRRHSALAVVHSISMSSGEVWSAPDLPRPFRLDGDPVVAYQAHVVRVEQLDQNGKIRQLSDLNKLLTQSGYAPVEVGDDKSVLAIDAAGNVKLFRRLEDGEDLVLEHTAVRVKSDSDNRLPLAFAALAKISVGIVGLGSLGSKVAESLARTGVGRFYLVDDDLFFPENAIRHALDLRSVGDHKAAAVAELLEHVSPHTVAEHGEISLGGQESNSVLSKELARLADCDLVIDATADPQVFNLLAAAVTSEGKPLLWAQVFAGGIGGFVARSRPTLDPPPHQVRRCLAAYSAEHPASDAPRTEPYGAMGSNEEVQIASDADVSVIASILAELTLDVLLGRQPARFPHSLYLIGLARAWVFTAPLHVIPLDVGEATDTPDDEETDVEQVEAGLKFVRQLISEAGNAGRPSQ